MIFAKLFERDGVQVLVTKDYDDDDYYVDFTIDVPLGRVTAKLGFDSQESRDAAFAKVNEDMAFKERDVLYQQLKGIGFS